MRDRWNGGTRRAQFKQLQGSGVMLLYQYQDNRNELLELFKYVWYAINGISAVAVVQATN